MLVLAGCKDTDAGDRWRVIEPRVSVGTKWHRCEPILKRGHLIGDVRCASPAPLATCDRDVLDADAAREAVALRSPCLDLAIATLQKTSGRNAGALTDLAAAYYVRAQRDDKVSDLLRALDAAEGAAAVRPAPPGAHFNQGLILESLGLNQQAIEAWTKAEREESGEWSREARAHREALATSLADTGERRWELAKAKIANALARNDEKAIEAIIAPFRFTAKDYFERVLLPGWAHDPSVTRLAQLKIFATALSNTGGDNYAKDIADSIDRAARSPARLAALKDGYARMQHAGSLVLHPDAAAVTYRSAAVRLKQGGSPLYLKAEVGLSAAMLNQEGVPRDEILPRFRQIARLAAGRNYIRLEMSARSNAANVLLLRDRLMESLAGYDEVLAFYQSAGDREGVANTQARRVGVLRSLGQNEEALRAALPSLHDAANIVDWNSHHLLIGETAAIATQIECPRSALDLLNVVNRHFNDELKATPPDDTDTISMVESNIAIARENRAAVEVRLGQYPQTARDLAETVRLSQKKEGISERNAFEAQLHEIRGTSLLNTDPNGAVAELKRAAALDGKEYASFRVAVLVETAQALRLAGRHAEAEENIRMAIDQIGREEAGTLSKRNLENDPIWNGYFDRYRVAYDLLVRQFMEDGRPDEAFAYNEQSHAAEPLDLIVRSGFAAPAVKELATAPAKLLLPKIASQLPADTYIVEYRALEDVTYAWVVSHGAARWLELQAKRSDVERWTAALQEAATHRDDAAFVNGLYAPYDRLIAPVLARIHLTENTRLVFVPDEFMHALPFAGLRDPNSRRHLIEQATVSIAGNAKLYVASLFRNRAMKRSNQTTALLVGDPAFDTRYAPETPHLKGARNEVEQLRSWYAPHVKELVGEKATVQRFLQDARKSQIVHVAAHAITYGDAPSQSFLLLTPSGNDTGVLDAHQLLTALHLDDTRLVVLGACHSGGNVAVGPQGVAPLVRPFLAAGVPGVVGTLWDINDATAKEVLVSFHRHYRRGSDAAAALRAAQIELLNSKNPGLSPELTWAGYQVTGYASSPFPPAGEMKKEKPPP